MAARDSRPSDSDVEMTAGGISFVVCELEHEMAWELCIAEGFC